MFCPQCGHQVSDSAAFCPQCGAALPSHAPAEKPQPTPAETSRVDVPALEATQVRPPISGAAATQDELPAQPTQPVQPVATPSVPPTAPVPPTPPLPPRPSAGSTPGRDPRRSNRGLKIAIGCVVAALIGVGLWFCIADPADIFGHGPRSQAEAQRQAQEAADAKEAQKEAEEAAKEAQEKQKEAEKRAHEAEEAQKSQKEQDASKDPDDLEDQVAQGIASSSDYALENTRTHTYTADELEDLSNYQLFIVRNEIFARYGREFKNPDLARYFASKSWYTPLYSGEEFDAMPNPLTAAEKANCDTILALEQSRNSEYLKAPYV